MTLLTAILEGMKKYRGTPKHEHNDLHMAFMTHEAVSEFIAKQVGESLMKCKDEESIVIMELWDSIVTGYVK